MLSLSDLLDAVEKQESGGNPRAISSVGARGAFQFMPATWKQYGKGRDIFDREASRDAAKRYLTDLYHKHGDAALALAAYNGGDGAAAYLAKHPDLIAHPDYKAPANQWRHQTADYVHKILKMVNPISDANAAEDDHPTGKGFVQSNNDEWEDVPVQKPLQQSQADNSDEWEDVTPSPTTQQPPKEQTLLEAAGTGLTNLPESTWNMVKGIGKQVVEHPIDTLIAPIKMLNGAVDNTLPESLQGGSEPSEGQKMSSQLADTYKQRYGTMQGFKEVLANDPASIMMDLSMGAGGVGLAAKSANLPRAASIANKVAVNSNPLVMPFKTAQLAGKAVEGIGSNIVAPILGKTTGAGTESIRRAASAGAQGGEAEQALIENMRGKVGQEQALQNAKNAHSNMFGENSAQYKADLEPIFADKTVLDFKPIRAAMDNIDSAGQYKGVNINTKTSEIKGEIKQVIDEWEALSPNEYHTVEGLDSLKKSLGEIRDATQERTPERIIADKAYNSVKTQIEKQSPAYGDAMKRYAKAAKENKEITKALSLGDKVSQDTAIRKLQSVMRNDANTNWGHRVSLVDKLTENGAPYLMEELAGQSLSAPMPRGIAGGVLPTALTGASLYTGAGIPMAAGALLTGSPRIVGELALKAGQAKRALTYPQRSITELLNRKPPPAALTEIQPDNTPPVKPVKDALKLGFNTGEGDIIKFKDGSQSTRAERVKQLVDDKGFTPSDAAKQAQFEFDNPAKPDREPTQIRGKGVIRLGSEANKPPKFSPEKLAKPTLENERGTLLQFDSKEEAAKFVKENGLDNTHAPSDKQNFGSYNIVRKEKPSITDALKQDLPKPKPIKPVSKAINHETDNLLSAIRKLGGIDKKMFEKTYGDTSFVKENGVNAFSPTGKSIDDLQSQLRSEGFLIDNGDPHQLANMLYELDVKRIMSNAKNNFDKKR